MCSLMSQLRRAQNYGDIYGKYEKISWATGALGEIKSLYMHKYKSNAGKQKNLLDFFKWNKFIPEWSSHIVRWFSCDFKWMWRKSNVIGFNTSRWKCRNNFRQSKFLFWYRNFACTDVCYKFIDLYFYIISKLHQSSNGNFY